MKRAVIIAMLFALGIVMLAGCNGKTVINGAKLGNDPGNIASMGLVASDDDWVYFSNVRDQLKLYKMRVDESEVTKLSDRQALYLNVVGDEIIFLDITDQNIVRIRKDGSQEQILFQDPVNVFGGVVVADDAVYYSLASDGMLYRTLLSEDSSQKELVSDHKIAYLNAAAMGLVYLAVKGDNEQVLVAVPFGGNERYEISLSGVMYPITYDQWIYFTQGSDNQLYRIRFLDKSDTALKSLERVSTIKTTHATFIADQLYYINIDDGFTYRCAPDGSSPQKVAEGLNFLAFFSDRLLYQDPLRGGVPMTMKTDGSDKKEFLAVPLVEEITEELNSITQLGNSEFNALSGILIADDSHLYTAFSKSGRALVKMLPDGSQPQTLVLSARWLNGYQEWIYYVNSDGFNAIERIKTDGNQREVVAQVNAGKMMLIGNHLFYIGLSDQRLHRIRPDGREDMVLGSIQISDFQPAFRGQELNFVVKDVQSDGLLILSDQGEVLAALIEKPVSYYAFESGWVYYSSEDEQSGMQTLRKISMDLSKDLPVNEDLASEIGIFDGSLYYFNGNEEEGIIRLSLDGKKRWVLTPTGNYSQFSIAFGYLYFKDNYSENDDMYRVKLDGSDLQKLP